MNHLILYKQTRSDTDIVPQSLSRESTTGMADTFSIKRFRKTSITGLLIEAESKVGE